MRRLSGFTLIEVVVVLVVMSVIASLLTLNVSASHTADDEVERLRLVLEAVAERAQIRGTPLAVELLPQGYRCSAFDLRGNWTPIRNEPLFAQQDLSEALQWHELRIDGRVSPLTVVFSSEMPVFDLEIATATGNLHLVSTPTGSVLRRSGVKL
jgi:general secretion pathway protein H